MSETGVQIFGGLGLLVRGSNRPIAACYPRQPSPNSALISKT